MSFEGGNADFQILQLDRFDGGVEDRLRGTHPGTGRSVCVSHDGAEGLHRFPGGTLHLYDGVLGDSTAGLTVGLLEGRVFEPAPGGHLPDAGGPRRVRQCGRQEERTNESFLLPGQLFAVPFPLPSSAFNGTLYPAAHAGTNGLPHVGQAPGRTPSNAVISREIVLGCTPNHAARATREVVPAAMSWAT